MGCLYKLTSPSRKSYIGISSKTAAERWAKHIEHAIGKRESGALYNALRKYGPHSFSVETLTIGKVDYLRELERRAIRSFGTLYPNGYNVALGGEGWIGPRNDEFRARVSVAQKKRFSNPEQLKLLRLQGMTGAARNAARLAALRIDGQPQWKIRQKKKREENRQWAKPKSGQPMSAEARRVISAAVKKAMLRPEIKGKLVACARARAANPEWRKKLSVQRTGYKYPPCTDEARRNHSEGAKRMWIRRKAKNVAQS